MFKQRLFTAAILIPLVLLAIWMLPAYLIHLLSLLVVALAAREWVKITGFCVIERMSTMVIIVLASIVVWAFCDADVVLPVATIFWILATGFVVIFANRVFPERLCRFLHYRIVIVITALILFSCFSYALNFIHQQAEQGPALLLYILITVWLADTGGYFAGKHFGKHKLAVVISPNKTWEGVVGAWLLSTVWAVFCYLYMSSLSLPLWQWLLLNWMVVNISIVGDLFESVFKRQFDVKDSGDLLPGHGGVLDRIDSLLAAVPVFAYMVMSLGAI